MCAAGAVAEPIKIGVLLPSSGVYAGLGGDQTLALELGFDEFGREVAGRPIELIHADSEANPGTGLALVKRLILRDEVDIVVGIISSAVAGAVRDFVHNAEVPLIVSNAGNDDPHRPALQPVDPALFLLQRADQPRDGAVDGRPGLPERVPDGVRLRGRAPGHGGVSRWLRRRRRHRQSARSIRRWARPRTFGPYLAKVKAANPDAAYVFFAGGPAIQFVKEWAAFGLKDEIQLAGAGWLNSALYVNAQGMDAEGTLGILNYVPSIDTPANQVFQEKFRAAHGRDGSEFGVAAYDSARLIVEALKATGGNTDDKAALVAAMRDTSFDGPRGPFRIDPATNNVIQNVYIFEVQAQGDGVAAVVQDMVADVQDPPNGCEL